MINKHINDQTGVLLFELQREKTTSIFLGEIQNNIVPVARFHIVSLNVVSFHLGMEKDSKIFIYTFRMTKPPSMSTSSSSLPEKTITSPSLYTTSYSLKGYHLR